jgi:hypothetical protein
MYGRTLNALQTAFWSRSFVCGWVLCNQPRLTGGPLKKHKLLTLIISSTKLDVLMCVWGSLPPTRICMTSHQLWAVSHCTASLSRFGQCKDLLSCSDPTNSKQRPCYNSLTDRVVVRMTSLYLYLINFQDFAQLPVSSPLKSFLVNQFFLGFRRFFSFVDQNSKLSLWCDFLSLLQHTPNMDLKSLKLCL